MPSDIDQLGSGFIQDIELFGKKLVECNTKGHPEGLLREENYHGTTRIKCVECGRSYRNKDEMRLRTERV